MATNQASNLESTRRILLVETQSKSNYLFCEKLIQQEIEPFLVTNDLDTVLDVIEKIEATTLIFAVDVVDQELVRCISEINAVSPLPIAVFAKHHSAELLQALIVSGVNSYIVDDIAAQRLPVIVNLVETRFAHEQKIRHELIDTREKLAERKVIEKAKGLIMTQKKISEDQAYTQLRKSAMNQCRPMADLAKSVISVFE